MNIGIVRSVDDVGRLCILKKFYTALGIKNGDPVDISAETDKIIIRKPNYRGCVFCGNELEVKEIHGVRICRNCALEMPGVFGGEPNA